LPTGSSPNKVACQEAAQQGWSPIIAPQCKTAPHGAVFIGCSMSCKPSFTTIVENFKEFDFRHKHSLSQTFLLLYGFLHTASLNAFFKTIEGTS
ncbi:hypothetical protein, partial [Aeromonas caviae]|uniref:hypothetical protein n=1 Tax=Aeromonas caviae TaxID=648 RepID=UPI001FC7F1EF